MQILFYEGRRLEQAYVGEAAVFRLSIAAPWKQVFCLEINYRPNASSKQKINTRIRKTKLNKA